MSLVTAKARSVGNALEPIKTPATPNPEMGGGGGGRDRRTCALERGAKNTNLLLFFAGQGRKVGQGRADGWGCF